MPKKIDWQLVSGIALFMFIPVGMYFSFNMGNRERAEIERTTQECNDSNMSLIKIHDTFIGVGYPHYSVKCVKECTPEAIKEVHKDFNLRRQQSGMVACYEKGIKVYPYKEKKDAK